jgi:hypothetical protein
MIYDFSNTYLKIKSLILWFVDLNTPPGSHLKTP